MEDFQIFGRFSDLWKIFEKISDFHIFGNFLNYFEDFQIFGKISDFWKNFRFLEKISDFWETTTATKTILGLVTFETLITILTIKNLNS